jgi:hypothetical protein
MDDAARVARGCRTVGNGSSDYFYVWQEQKAHGEVQAVRGHLMLSKGNGVGAPPTLSRKTMGAVETLPPAALQR